jgi:uncharacterized cupredoxin-like copper-binding protein
MRSTHLAALLAASVLALTACGEDRDEESSTGTTGTGTQEAAPEPTGPAVATVKLTESEFKIEPASLQVTKSGVIQFDVKNTGKVTHALEVEGGDVEEETDEIPAGGSASLEVNLEPGSYELYCPIDGHKDKGMEGDLNVGLPAGSSEEGEEREREEENDSGY